MIGDAAVEGRQASHTVQPRGAARDIDNDAVLDQFARDDPRHPPGRVVAALHRQHPAAVMVEREAHVGARHGEAAHDFEAGGIFGPRTAQEFAPRGH